MRQNLMSNESYADFLVRMIETSAHGSLMGTFISSALEKASRTAVVATYEELGVTELSLILLSGKK